MASNEPASPNKPSTPPPSQTPSSNNSLWIILAVAAGGVGLAYYLDWFSLPLKKDPAKKIADAIKSSNDRYRYWFLQKVQHIQLTYIVI